MCVCVRTAVGARFCKKEEGGQFQNLFAPVCPKRLRNILFPINPKEKPKNTECKMEKLRKEQMRKDKDEGRTDGRKERRKEGRKAKTKADEGR